MGLSELKFDVLVRLMEAFPPDSSDLGPCGLALCWLEIGKMGVISMSG